MERARLGQYSPLTWNTRSPKVGVAASGTATPILDAVHRDQTQKSIRMDAGYLRLEHTGIVFHRARVIS